MVSNVNDIVVVRKLDVESDGQVTLVVILLVGVVVAVAVVAYVCSRPYPTWQNINIQNTENNYPVGGKS